VTTFWLGRSDDVGSGGKRLPRRLYPASGAKFGAPSMPELANDHEIDLVPVLRPDDFDGEVTRINVDLWERAERTKEALPELAKRLAKAFQTVAGEDRRVKVLIRPYDVERSGWVSR
jgi:hypothetical protein